ncbi:replication factor C large subunit [Candidatus Pacearchaeota archaeon]|nr:replication factor C large subunit [Candidatus Pacearchaeota archaeon]
MINPYQNYAERYRPKKFYEIKGQDKAIDELKLFLREFPKRKALMLHGPAGTGKTSLVLAAVKEFDLDILELNASDLRNRAKLEGILKPASLQQSLLDKRKVLLMDEVDGVTGSDIGGIPELIRIIEITKHPIIMTCNDVWQSKLSQLRQKCKLVELKALSREIIIFIMNNIAQRENIKIEHDFLNKIAIKSQGDVRAAINDLQSYSKGEDIYVDSSERRDVEDSIFNILKRVFKERSPFMDIFDSTKMSLDEILLWLEENIPREYKNEALVKAYYALGKADIFRGRIYRNQSWRFLVYQNIFQSAGISFAKSSPLPFTFTKYEPPKRILKIWLHNQKSEKKKTIAKKYAKAVHCSTKRAMRDFALLKNIMKNSVVQGQLKLSEEEISFLNK